MGNCDLYLAASLLVLIVSIHLSLDLLFNMPLPNALFAQAKTKAMIEGVSQNLRMLNGRFKTTSSRIFIVICHDSSILFFQIFVHLDIQRPP